jgi:hypothetical protein
MADPTIYDLLSKKDISEVTITLLNAATNVTAVDRKTVDFWTGPITLNRVLEASRTMAHGLPIQETGAISSNVVANGATAQVKPTGTEIWRIQAITSSADVPVSLYDGATNQIIHSGTSPQVFANLFITPTLYLAIANGSGSEVTVNIAYVKVSL